MAFEGTFDSLNPFNLKAGSTAQGINGNIYQTLHDALARRAVHFSTASSLSSIETDAARSYCDLSTSIRVPGSLTGLADNGRRCRLHLCNLLKKKGRPQQRAAYAYVTKAATLDCSDGPV